MSDLEQNHLELATSADGHKWSNKKLLQKLLSSKHLATKGSWAIWHWSKNFSLESQLELRIGHPPKYTNSSQRQNLIKDIRQCLGAALNRYGSERNWPLVSVTIKAMPIEKDSWNYRLKTHSTDYSQNFASFSPNKYLVLGESTELEPILGVATLDPIYSLPAKWVSSSQKEYVQSLGLHLLDVPELITAHLLLVLAQDWCHYIGLIELQKWLIPALTDNERALKSFSALEYGLLLRSINELIADDLWLPPARLFLDTFLQALGVVNNEQVENRYEFIIRELRKVIIPKNLSRLAKTIPNLQAIEWIGSSADEEDDDLAHKRMLNRLASTLDSFEDTESVLIITDREHRLELKQALRNCFPKLNVFCWQEMPNDYTPPIVRVIDSKLELDPSPWPYKTFSSP